MHIILSLVLVLNKKERKITSYPYIRNVILSRDLYLSRFPNNEEN